MPPWFTICGMALGNRYQEKIKELELELMKVKGQRDRHRDRSHRLSDKVDVQTKQIDLLRDRLREVSDGQLSHESPPRAINADFADLESCPCCGGKEFEFKPVLWDELIQSWGLSEAETLAYNYRDGLICTGCQSNLRAMNLARGLLTDLELRDQTLDSEAFVSAFSDLKSLEINQAANLTQFFEKSSNHTLGEYPEVDAQALPYEDGSFDLVIHSETMEHVPETPLAWRECRRVLRENGAVICTIPIIPGRQTRKCHADYYHSYHGGPEKQHADYRVFTEYGGDFWTEIVGAGFSDLRLISMGFESTFSLAIIARA